MKLHAATPLLFVSAVALAAPSAFPLSSSGSTPTPFDAAPIPSTSSMAPTAADWGAATPIELKWSFGCHARMTREWIRVACPGSPVRVAVIDGERSEVVFSGAMVTFPLRRGTRTAIQLWSTLAEVAPSNSDHGSVRLISAYWLDDEPRPVVTIQ